MGACVCECVCWFLYGCVCMRACVGTHICEGACVDSCEGAFVSVCVWAYVTVGASVCMWMGV